GDEDIKSGSLVPARFEIPFNNTTIQKGQAIPVQISIAEPSEVKTIKVFTKDTIIYEGAVLKSMKSLQINTSTWSYGTNQLTLETTLNDGKTRRDHRIIKILPDVFPEEYAAEVLKVYPHATTSYTQGLEFDGDQLYEGTGGTGATGKSMVAKVDLKS